VTPWRDGLPAILENVKHHLKTIRQRSFGLSQSTGARGMGVVRQLSVAHVQRFLNARLAEGRSIRNVHMRHVLNAALTRAAPSTASTAAGSG
jgi:hypothetical protein